MTVKLSESDIRFQIKRGLQQVPRSTLQDLVAGGRDRHERGIETATDVILARFARLEVFRPDSAKSTFEAQTERAQRASDAE